MTLIKAGDERARARQAALDECKQYERAAAKVASTFTRAE